MMITNPHLYVDYDSPEVQEIYELYQTAQDRHDAICRLAERIRLKEETGVITPAQQVFIDEVLRGKSHAEAYRIAYPDCSVEASYACSSRLYNRPAIQDYINNMYVEVRMRDLNMQRNAINKDLRQIIERRGVLDEMIHGKRITRTTSVNKDTGATIVHFREENMSIINAMKLDIKLRQMQKDLEEELSSLGYTVAYPDDEEMLHGIPGNTGMQPGDASGEQFDDDDESDMVIPVSLDGIEDTTAADVPAAQLTSQLPASGTAAPVTNGKLKIPRVTPRPDPEEDITQNSFFTGHKPHTQPLRKKPKKP